MHLSLIMKITSNNKWRWDSDITDSVTLTLWTVSLMTLIIKIITVVIISKSWMPEIGRLLVNKTIALQKVKTCYRQRWVTVTTVRTFSQILMLTTTLIVKDLRINLSCNSHLIAVSRLHLIMIRISRMNT
jgi:hypothetical protein